MALLFELLTMKVIVTHFSPDWDAIGSVWVIKKFLPGWQEAKVEFVQPGDKSSRVRSHPEFETDVIVNIDEDEIIHVDTGNGPLDHHIDPDTTVSGAWKSWEYVKAHIQSAGDHFSENHEEAISRMMKVIVRYDHFQDIFMSDPDDDYYDLSLNGLLDGLKLEKQGQDDYFVDFGIQCLDAIFHKMENKVWMEKELAEKGVEFETRYGKGIGLETMNHVVLKQGQRMGYVIVVRKDPRNGYLAVASQPEKDVKKKIDLTLVYEQLRKMDPDATWYFHASKQILLNGSTRSEKMKTTKLKLDDIIKVIKQTYK